MRRGRALVAQPQGDDSDVDSRLLAPLAVDAKTGAAVQLSVLDAQGDDLRDAGTRDAILFDEVAQLPGKPKDALLARELSAAWLACLGVRPRRRS